MARGRKGISRWELIIDQSRKVRLEPSDQERCKQRNIPRIATVEPLNMEKNKEGVSSFQKSWSLLGSLCFHAVGLLEDMQAVRH